MLLSVLQVRLHCGLQHENVISLYAAWQEAGNVVLLQVCTVTGLAVARVHHAPIKAGSLSPAQPRHCCLLPAPLEQCQPGFHMRRCCQCCVT